MSTPFGFIVIILGVVAAVAAIWGIVWLAMRVAFRRKVESLGWTLDAHPGIDVIWGLNCPPFGLGNQRRVSDLITGTVGGFAFRALRYDHAGGDRAVVALFPLRTPLPEAHLSRPGHERDGIAGVQLSGPQWSVIARDEAWANTVLSHLSGAAEQLAQTLPDASVSLDGNYLTLAPLPQDPEELSTALQAATSLVVAASTLTGSAPVVPDELSVYGHSDWIYRVRDDGALDRLSHTQFGHNHAAEDVYYAGTSMISVIACTHTWDTTETRTVTDSEGRSHTETYTVHHTEWLAGGQLGFPFVDIGINTGSGAKQRFESDDFNRAYRVRCDDARFASDVIHPQTMEWLLRTPTVPFAVEGRYLRFEVGSADVPTVEACLATASGFFGRVRRYTWQNLGLAESPVPSVIVGE